jgi:O-acetylhomoserine/O-acetylserine sulfhydrylase-like pyridoxal-dependent enzyme
MISPRDYQFPIVYSSNTQWKRKSGNFFGGIFADSVFCDKKEQFFVELISKFT